jgi:Tol biopolymer transport system component
VIGGAARSTVTAVGEAEGADGAGRSDTASSVRARFWVGLAILACVVVGSLVAMAQNDDARVALDGRAASGVTDDDDVPHGVGRRLVVTASSTATTTPSTGDDASSGATGTGASETSTPPDGDSPARPDSTTPPTPPPTSLLGRVVFESDGRQPHGLWSVAPDGSDPRPLLSADEWSGVQPDVAPDGRSVAYISIRLQQPDVSQVRVMAFDGTGDRRLPLPDRDWMYPRFSPDGSRLILSQGGPDGRLWMVDADGTNAHPLDLDVTVSNSPASWAPDGSRIVVDGTGTAGRGVYVVTLASGTAVPLPVDRDNPDEPANAAWSPNGREIAYEWWDSATNAFGLASIDVTSGAIRQVAAGRFHEPAWSPDGQTLITYRTSPAGGFELWAVDRSGANLHRVATQGCRPAM